MRQGRQISVIGWLGRKAPGFGELSPGEKSVIMQFALLWSFFESKALATNGNVQVIASVVRLWTDRGVLTAGAFEGPLAYFHDRYCENGELTYHFAHLNFKPRDKRDLVEKVIRGQSEDPVEIATALLIIVYRLRNNLFHGVKWAYDIQDQKLNFTHANAILMQAIDLHEAATQQQF